MAYSHLAKIALPLALAGAIATGCGGSSSSPSKTSAADATSAATGDIPDNQNFLTFSDKRAGFSMRYPEGWSVKKSGAGVAFQDKDNLVRVDVHKGSVPTVASVSAELAKQKAKDATLKAQAPQPFDLKGQRAVKVKYTTTSATNQVTGKRLVLMVDRYEVASKGKVAVIDLATPTGVDNVDAYRLMSESFRWR